MITATGIGSGLDIDGLVAGLVSAEGDASRQRLIQNESDLTVEIAALGRLQASLSAFSEAADALNSTTTFDQQLVTSSNWGEVVPSLSGDAALGVYDIEVTTLATAQSLVSGVFSSSDAIIGTGTLTINVGTPTYVGDGSSYSGFINDANISATSIVIDSSNNSLSGIRDAINNAGDNYSASILKDGDQYRLLISAAQTGLSNSLSLTVSADGDGDNLNAGGLSALAFDGTTNNLTQTRSASDASFKINGLALTSETNKVANAVDGLALELKKVTTGVSVDVSYDNGSVLESVNTFINSYNDVVTTIDDLTSYDVTSGVAGDLQGDSVPRAALAAVRSIVEAEVEGLDEAFNQLNDIGILPSSTGGLSLESTVFEGFLDSNRTQVASLFSGDGTLTSLEDGVSGLLKASVADYTNSTGLIANKTESLNERIGYIKDSQERLELRLQDVEARYYRQFNAMDALIARLNSTGDFLLAQLDSMPAANRDKK